MHQAIYFSVVIPLYNKEKYIRHTIDSVIYQTYPNFEIIVVDDGSSDHSLQIVKEIDDSRLRYINQINKGVSFARNLGASISKHEWIAFLDADDEYEPNFLEEIEQFITKNTNHNISLIGTNYYIDNIPAFSTTLKCGFYNYFELFNNLKTPNNSSSTVVNKRYFDEISGFPINIKYYEDWITWIKLAGRGDFGFISTPLSRYNRIKGSTSQGFIDVIELNSGIAFLIKVIKEQLNQTDDPLIKEIIKKKLNSYLFCISSFLLSKGEYILALKYFIKIRGIFNIEIDKRSFFNFIEHLIINNKTKRIFRYILKL